MSSYLDTKKFSDLVRIKIGNRGLRETAGITGVSASTISRVEKGQTPDLETFLALCDWLEIPPVELIKNTEKQPDSETPQSICLKLRSDQRLPPEIANALAVLIEAAYSASI